MPCEPINLLLLEGDHAVQAFFTQPFHILLHLWRLEWFSKLQNEERLESPSSIWFCVSAYFFLENGKCSLASSDVGMAGWQMCLPNSEVFLFISCRPHSTDSATHRKMTLSLADRCSKTQKIRILPMAGRDPECQRTEMIKVCWLSFFLEFWYIRKSISQNVVHHLLLIYPFLLPSGMNRELVSIS